MGRAGVKLDDGSVVIVEYPKGATDAEIKALAVQQGKPAPTVKGRPVVPPETPGLVKPSAGGYVAEGLRRRAGDIGAAIGATVAPGSGLLGLASRLAGAEAGGLGGQTVTGEKKTPGFFAASQLVGEGVAKAAAPLVSPATYRAFADRQVKALGDAMKRLVPAFGTFPSTHRGVYEMAHGTGPRVLSQDFERSVTGIKRAIPETLIVEVPEVVETAGRREIVGHPRNARALIDDLPKLREAGGAPYYQALRALRDQLPDGLAPELDAARTAYRYGSGLIDIARKGKFLYGERYDPVKAQQSLDRFGPALLGRGMDEIRTILRGPGAEPIQAVTHNPFVRRIEGALTGGALGYPFGIPHAVGGAAGGLVAGEMLPRTTYKNVPLTPAARWAGRLAPVVVGEAAREAARRFNAPERVYGR